MLLFFAVVVRRERKWIRNRGKKCCREVKWGTLDLSGPFRALLTSALVDATLAALPYPCDRTRQHRTLCECRRRVQLDLFGTRGRAGDLALIESNVNLAWPMSA